MTADLTRLYPDLAAAGGLSPLLQQALEACGSALRVSGLGEAEAPLFSAKVESGTRFSGVLVAAEERLFLPNFCNRGVVLAYGRTQDLGDAARAINRWVGSECTMAGLASDFDFVSVEPHAESYERGDEVEHRWRDYLARRDDSFCQLEAIILAASRRPELRQLFPFTSMNTLCFSRCTGYPFTRDTPHVRPLSNGRYEVFGPNGQALGLGDAEAAVRLVVANLPTNCGPALPGTADELPA